MSAEFSFPDWWATVPESPPPAPPPVDADRIEGLANRFITASHGVLHTAPDAFFGKTAADAVEGAPAVAAQLSALHDATLDLAHDEHERQALADRLKPYHRLALDDVDRHVAEQRQGLARQTIADRQALIRQAAALEHNEDALGGLAEANAGAARSLAQLDGVPEEPAMQAARSAIWRSAIDQRLADGEGARALNLFEQGKGQLVPADQRALAVPIQAARTDGAADAWIVRETAKAGEPLTTRVQADATLSPAEKATTLAKVEAQDSTKESARVATVQGLDDKLGAASQALATQPSAYKAGMLAAIADGYDAASEPDKANVARRVARQETFLLPFTRSSVAAQQRLIESLPEGEGRSAAEAIQRQQAAAFAKDAFTAGTALYPEVGPPMPIDNLAGRIAQARTIAAYRGTPVAPYTAGEIATMRRQLAGTPQEREALLTRLNALPDDEQAAVASSLGVSSDERDEKADVTTDPNVVLAADKDNKEKKPPLLGGGNRPSLGDELPPPKQIDPLGGRGVPGFRLPGFAPKALPKTPTLTQPIKPGGNQSARESSDTEGKPETEPESETTRRERISRERAQRVRNNYAIGRAYEQKAEKELQEQEFFTGSQIMIETESGVRTRVDTFEFEHAPSEEREEDE